MVSVDQIIIVFAAVLGIATANISGNHGGEYAISLIISFCIFWAVGGGLLYCIKYLKAYFLEKTSPTK